MIEQPHPLLTDAETMQSLLDTPPARPDWLARCAVALALLMFVIIPLARLAGGAE